MQYRLVVLAAVVVAAAAQEAATEQRQPQNPDAHQLYERTDLNLQSAIGQINDFLNHINEYVDVAQRLEEAHENSVDMLDIKTDLAEIRSLARDADLDDLEGSIKAISKDINKIGAEFKKIGRLGKQIAKIRKIKDNLITRRDNVASVITNSLLRSCFLHHRAHEDIHNGEYYEHEGACYWIGEERLQWSDARAACIRRGMDLASVVTEDQQNFLVDILSPVAESRPTFWLSGHRNRDSDFEWFAADHLAVNAAEYSNWGRGEPNNYGTGEACMTFWHHWKWNDFFCTREERFVCQSY